MQSTCVELFKTVPFDHQYKTLERMWNWPYFAFLWEMGTGKSKVVLDNAAWLFRAQKITRLCVLAPKGVYTNWTEKEIPTHLPEYCPVQIVVWQPNHTQRWLKKWNALDDPRNIGTLKILVMNIEALSTKKGEAFAKKFCSTGAMVVVDESTFIKNYGATRTKAACRVAAQCQYRRILTGTPTPKDPLDLWSQFKFLSGDTEHLLGHPTIWSFKQRYAKTVRVRFGNTRAFDIVVGWKNTEELSKRIAKVSNRIKKEDCFDLPDRVYLQRYVEPTSEQTKAYASMAHELLTVVDNTRVDATVALTQINKLQQIMCGFIIDNDGKVHRISHNRLEALRETIEEINPDESVVIWAHYREAIKDIAEFLEANYGADSVVTYYGDTSVEERTRAVESFQVGSARFFVGNPQTAGYGLTLTRASHCVYYSRGYDWAQREQSEARVHRYGQTKKVAYIDLLTLGSIEGDILEALRQKMTLTAALLREKVPEWLSSLPQKDRLEGKRTSYKRKLNEPLINTQRAIGYQQPLTDDILREY